MKTVYSKYIKRVLDFIISLLALTVLSPLLLVLTLVGAVKMRGNPFFVQERPGRNGRVFRLIKLRSMTNEKKNGELLPDRERLTEDSFTSSPRISQFREVLSRRQWLRKSAR